MFVMFLCCHVLVLFLVLLVRDARWHPFWGGVVSGFCHFSLVLFMVLWQSPDTPFMSCFYVSARLRVCSSRALSCLRALFCVGAWCSDPGTHVLSFGFVSGFGHSRSMFRVPCSHCVSVRLEFARPHALLSTCVVCVWCCTQFVFLSAACIHVMSCAVWHAAHVFHWLRAFMLSCFVWTRGLWVFSLAACSCPVLHMAGDLFCWPCACVFVLCEHMAFVLVFCVPCALMSIVLTPPILLPDYWLICPTCVYLITLLICSLYNLLVFAVPCQFVIYVTVESSLLPCLALSCPAKPYLVANRVFPPRGSFGCLFCFIFNQIKAHSPAPLSPRLIPSPQPWQMGLCEDCFKFT